MRFALVNGQRQEAQPNSVGVCPLCGSPTIAKCGEVRVHHWAHKGNHLCDSWWENETEWHRAWKDQFPVEWQEFVHTGGNSERHIADVKTGRGWVIEFQHSHLNPEERRSREAFYQRLIWVVDATSRKRDTTQFIKAWNEGLPVNGNALVRRAFSDGSRLLREWAVSTAPMFVDLGEVERLWWVFAKSSNGATHILPFSRALFIQWHRSAETVEALQLDEFVSNELPKLVLEYESRSRPQPVRWDPFQPRVIRRSRRL